MEAGVLRTEILFFSIRNEQCQTLCVFCLKFVFLDVVAEGTKCSHPAAGFLQNRAYVVLASQGPGYGEKFCDHSGNDLLKPSMQSNGIHVCKSSTCVALSKA